MASLLPPVGWLSGEFFIQIRLPGPVSADSSAEPDLASASAPTASASSFNVPDVACDPVADAAPNVEVELLRRADRTSFKAQVFLPPTSPALGALRDIAGAVKPDGTSFPSHLLMEVSAASDSASVTIVLKEVTPSKRVFSFEDGTIVAKRVVVVEPAAATGGAGTSASSTGGAYSSALELRVAELEAQVTRLSSESSRQQTAITELTARVSSAATASNVPSKAATAAAADGGCAACSCARNRGDLDTQGLRVEALEDQVRSLADSAAEALAMKERLSEALSRLTTLEARVASGGSGAHHHHSGSGSGVIGNGSPSPSGLRSPGVTPASAVVIGKGDQVRMKPSVRDAKYGWGALSMGYSKIGTATSDTSTDGKITINWPDQSNWSAAVDELDLVAFKPSVGDKVKLKPSIISPKYGAGKLTMPYRETGTVASVSGDTVRVDWPAQSGWSCPVDELERAGTAYAAAAASTSGGPGYGGFKVGDRVRLKSGLKSATFGWGSLSASYTGIGTIAKIDSRPDTVSVNWPIQSSWTAKIQELEHERGDSRGGFRVGDRVRVKSSVTTPRYGWGALSAGYSKVGTILRFSGSSDTAVDVNWPDQSDWTAESSELEAATASFNVGDSVRIKAGKTSVRYGFGSVAVGDIGRIVRVTGDDLVCDFDKQKGWHGHVEDMEVVTADATIQIGDRVRVKRSVGTPSFGWGSVNHSHIGILKSKGTTSWTVDFPGIQSGWSAAPTELERA